MSAEKVLEWRILPRFMMLVMTLMSWRVVEWFMTLPEPTAAQAGLVSVVTGAMTGAFAVWMNHEGKNPGKHGRANDMVFVTYGLCASCLCGTKHTVV
jgi:hypothetical protein